MATPSLDTLDIISPDHYQQYGYPHEEWALLRREAPIYWYTRTPGVPFWAVTKYQDIITISKQPRRLLNSPSRSLLGGRPLVSQKPVPDPVTPFAKTLVGLAKARLLAHPKLLHDPL